MPLTVTQLAALNDFLKTLDAGPAPAHLAAVTPGPGVPPPPTANWWRPTDADRAAFAAEMGIKAEQFVQWTFDPRGNIVKTSATSFPNLPPVTIVSEALKYAAFGYGPDGVQRLKTDVSFNIAREKCDTLASASPETRNDILRGAGDEGVALEAVQYALMAGNVDFNDRANMHVGGGKSVAEVMATMTKTGTGGGKPSGRP